MKLSEVKSLLNVETIYGKKDVEDSLIIKNACGADLMSDVLAFSQEKTMLLTGLTNPQVIRTAEMIGIQAIIFVRGKKPLSETVSLARKLEILLYSTEKPLFEACGLLYKYGIGPEEMNYI